MIWGLIQFIQPRRLEAIHVYERVVKETAAGSREPATNVWPASVAFAAAVSLEVVFLPLAVTS